VFIKPVNDITGYLALKEMILPGDCVLFDGHDYSDVVENVDHFLSNAIEIWTHAKWSHAAIVDQDKHFLLESTIMTGKDGPQLNDFETRLRYYDGPSVWLFPLLSDIRRQLDFDAMWSYMHAKIGKDHYSKRAILDYVLRPLGLGRLIKHINENDGHSEVCSEYVCLGLRQAAGDRIECLKNCNAHNTAPGGLVELPIFGKPQLLMRQVLPVGA
jgi:hypothetical protein